MKLLDIDYHSIPVPMVYSLSFNDLLVIEVPACYIPVFQTEIERMSRTFNSVQKELGLDQFYFEGMEQKILPFESEPLRWGFGGCIRVKQSTSMTKFIVDLRAKNQKFNFLDHISSSLRFLFDALIFVELEPLSGKPNEVEQLLAILGMVCHRGAYGGAIKVYLSWKVCQWLAKQPDESYHSAIQKAMVQASHRMRYCEGSRVDRGFKALIRHPQWINLDVPGNSCGLDPENYYVEEGKGYSLLPHNTDNPAQQLSLLAGVAKLYELVADDLNVQRSP